jgi:aryl-alcohol dehydrogenase-like predicted oxidoreductase
MTYTTLGATGLPISSLGLGGMSFGVPDRGTHPWTLDESQSRPIVRRAVELGITFFDTANSYSDGTGEEILGKLLRECTRREDIVVATKVYNRTRPGPYGAGLSRKAILHEIDASLRRLGMEYVDLYQIHRWDYATPIEETIEALHDVVRAGKARYLGASSMFAWQFAKALFTADRHGWTRFVSMQNHLNLMYREEERETIPLCRDQGVGLIPWSPLARGRLTRPWTESTARLETDEVLKRMYTETEAADKRVAERVDEVARRLGVPMARVALAWVRQKPGVSAPIVGATKVGQLEDLVAALELTLSPEDVAYLEAPYVPHRIAGHE